MRKMNKLVCGAGINDADYQVLPTINGKRVWCPYYRKWCSMLQRCYGESYHKRYPTYQDCTVCEEWLVFSNFKSWMETQEWEGYHLDKDFLFEGNKIYSPETCVFISRELNTFIIDCGNSRGEYPIGVYFNKVTNRFRSKCNNPFTKKFVHLGYYDTMEEAHQVWKKYKHQLALQYAELQADERIKQVLINKFK